MFDLLIHADWSVDARKRWAASAVRNDGGWTVEAPALVGPVAAFLDNIFEAAQRQRVILGFDFPIGVPVAYGIQTGFRDFREMLPALGEGVWRRFFDVARLPAEVAITRPCYPFVSTKGVSRAELVAGLGARRFDDLLRLCERRTAHRQDACSLFWTLGPNQVGKGAIAGLEAGFGSSKNGEDQFDALMGLLKMVEVIEGRRPERTETYETRVTWEGWILGR